MAKRYRILQPSIRNAARAGNEELYRALQNIDVIRSGVRTRQAMLNMSRRGESPESPSDAADNLRQTRDRLRQAIARAREIQSGGNKTAGGMGH